MEGVVSNSNQTERIGRYLSGSMSADEATRFHADLVADPGLRRMLDAEELIRGTIRRDLEALPSEHTATRAHVMGTLAILSNAARKGAIPDMKGGGNALPHGGTFLGSSAVKVAAGVLVGAGLTAGGFALFRGPAPMKPVQNSVPRVEQYQPPAAQMPGPAPDTGILQIQPRVAPAETSDAPLRAAASAKSAASSPHHERPSTERPKAQQSSTPPPSVSEPSVSESATTPKRRPVVTHTNPNVPLKVNVDKPKVVKQDP
jgi:hypothetical protein